MAMRGAGYRLELRRRGDSKLGLWRKLFNGPIRKKSPASVRRLVIVPDPTLQGQPIAVYQAIREGVVALAGPRFVQYASFPSSIQMSLGLSDSQ